MAAKQKPNLVITMHGDKANNFLSLLAIFTTFLLVATLCHQVATRAKWWWLEPLQTEPEKIEKSLVEECNLFEGKWVFDNKSYPLYRESNSSFMFESFACETYGRKDFKYQNWRWQPHQCQIPRFDAAEFLHKLRGKKMVFVGDSLNRNQFASLFYMLDSFIPPTLKSMQYKGNSLIFKPIEYNASIEFYWSPFLVESNQDDPFYHREDERTARLDSIEKHAKHWIDADILIFDSYIWWLGDKMKFLFGKSDGIYEEMEMQKSYEMALKTWANWLVTNVDRDRTRLFFMSLSPMHKRAREWDMDANGTCYNETEPIYEEHYWGSSSNRSMMGVVESAIQELKSKGLNIQLLNITQLSEYRKDAHPSIYRKQWVNLTEEQLSNPNSYADCGHWCLPGIPDTWNEILYTYMFHSK